MVMGCQGCVCSITVGRHADVGLPYAAVSLVFRGPVGSLFVFVNCRVTIVRSVGRGDPIMTHDTTDHRDIDTYWYGKVQRDARTRAYSSSLSEARTVS